MSMGSLGKAIKATRAEMLDREAEEKAKEFTQYFRMRDGDYIRFRKADGYWKQARILSVDEVYWNEGGRLTAIVTIVPLLTHGKIGKSRSLMLIVDQDGKNLRGLREDVERVSSSVKEWV